MDDDVESIITNERYIFVAAVTGACLKKKGKSNLTMSDKIDRIVTNRILGLPIFVVVMFVVYFVSVTTIGTIATDWTNDVLFGTWISNAATKKRGIVIYRKVKKIEGFNKKENKKQISFHVCDGRC